MISLFHQTLHQTSTLLFPLLLATFLSPHLLLRPVQPLPIKLSLDYKLVILGLAHTLIFISITQHVISFELCMQVLLFLSLVPMLKLLLYLNGIWLWSVNSKLCRRMKPGLYVIVHPVKMLFRVNGFLNPNAD